MSQPLTIFLVLLSLFFTNSSATHTRSSPTTCRPSQSTCGNVTIRYPFWLQGNNSNTTSNDSYCGYPGFGLTCSDAGHETAVLSLPSDTYYVKDINYTANTVTLVDIDSSNQLCPRARHNVTLQTLPLKFSAEYDLNLSFYFNCSKYPQFLPAIGCLDHQLMRSFVFEEGTERLAAFELRSEITCEEKVVAPVMRSEVEIWNLIGDFGGAMNNGFVLDWGILPNCSTCERSGGYCGYNETAGELLCFCNNGSIRSGHCKVQGEDTLRLVLILTPTATIVLLLGLVMCYLKRRKLKLKAAGHFNGNVPNLQVFTLDEIEAATGKLSIENKVGEGGYGPVYKGKLPNGQEIAVKKLSKTSKQGFEEFKNEVVLTAKLQHVNLVRLLGFCTERNEQMLIYEYMPNKSLDFYLFDPSKSYILDWRRRIGIIEGITQGLLYLQEYSRMTIIHRDIKASNILLDEEMKPKISDFGMARTFMKHEHEANTGRIVGTYGYVPPEYVKKGVYSTKSDVYSFGVLLLQIISGKRNAYYYGSDESLNLLEYAYELLKEDKGMDFMDPSLDDTLLSWKLNRCMQIALLCVQETAKDRPSMLEVSSMLKNESAALTIPKKPAFSRKTDEDQEEDRPILKQEICSDNIATISELVAR
ncbi:hypothetical protein I3760_16G088500 [Carya illinoinensis]|nr:hypothetical protein I3760_16G088500 [Carya illinoinensis]